MGLWSIQASLIPLRLLTLNLHIIITILLVTLASDVAAVCALVGQILRIRVMFALADSVV